MRYNYTEDEFAVRKNEMILAKMRTAQHKGIPFDIGRDDVIYPAYCPVLGYELDYSRKARGVVADNMATFDRVIPELGYVKGNVRIISARANRIKDSGTAEEHRKIAAYIDGSIYI